MKGVFSAEAFIEFERYISGLIVSENKTIDGINRWFVKVTDPRLLGVWQRRQKSHPEIQEL